MIFLYTLLLIVFTSHSCNQKALPGQKKSAIEATPSVTTDSSTELLSNSESTHIDITFPVSDVDVRRSEREDSTLNPHNSREINKGGKPPPVNPDPDDSPEISMDPQDLEEDRTPTTMENQESALGEDVPDNDSVLAEEKESPGRSNLKTEKRKTPVSLHDAWHELLQRHVTEKGVVNYSGFKKDQERLSAYLDQLASAMPASGDRSPGAMAFWINAYNAFTIQLILDNYPVTSIRDISNGNPWDVAWIEIGGKKFSLNNIEHDILRPTWKDARIHFAVNCAAKSCPPLANRAFTESNLEQLLEELTDSFINNQNYNKIAPSSLALSRIFDWYKEDFGHLSSFIDRYTSVKVEDDARISYLEYNWKLNGN